MARKFIVDIHDITNISQNRYKITGKEIKHIQVLRHNVNDNIIINNINFVIDKISKDYIEVTKVSDLENNICRNINVSLFQGFLKGDKMEFVVQKSVELGAKKIHPFFSKNVVVKLDDKDRIKRKEKFDKVAIEAIKQCGRTDDVIIEQFTNFKEMLNCLDDYDICIFAYENEKENIKQVISRIKNTKRIYKKIAVIVGPEGGFDGSEVELLKKKDNVYTVSLGSIILKAETASINLQSIVMYEFE